MINWNSSRLKTSVFWKTTLGKLKQSTECEKIFANHVSGKRLCLEDIKKFQNQWQESKQPIKIMGIQFEKMHHQKDI